MNDELIQAYRRTLYRVFDPDGEFVLRVDVPCPELLRCHARHGAESSLFITAWNPGSVPRSWIRNWYAQLRLAMAIRQGGFASLPGRGDDSDGKWTPEPSHLVLGADEAEARRLGREFRQLAVVFAGLDGIPRLLFPGPERSGGLE